MNREIKQWARYDRKQWLLGILDDGTWSSIKKHRRGFVPKLGRMRNMAGELVESEQKAETMADYFEKIQWQCTFADIQPPSEPIIEPMLNLPASQFTINELRKAIRKLKNNKACGPDGIPGECWRCILLNTDGMQKLLQLMNACWSNKKIPDEWQSASITAIFKKGDTSLPSNYRPIALLDIGYKCLAQMILARIQPSAELRIRNSQFGFRPNRSTSQALALIRRYIDLTLSDKYGELYILLLD